MFFGRKEEVEEEFNKALQKPMAIGNRIFFLGSLFGMRSYCPDYKPIQDGGRMLTFKGNQDTWVQARQEVSYGIYSVRKSILESQFADMLETYYGSEIQPAPPEAKSHPHNLWVDAFMKRDKGGLDDLVWIRDNDIAVCHFIDGKYEEAVKVFTKVNLMAPRNIIFMYRLGVCLEAMASQPHFKEFKEKEWQQSMERAISLYKNSLKKIKARRESWSETEIRGPDPKSLLTLMMQLADALEEIGNKSEAKKLWKEVMIIDPDCYEARDKVKRIDARALAASGLRKILGLLAARH